MITDFTEVNFAIPSGILWGALSLFIIILLILSAVLHHHWKYYGIKGNPKIYVKPAHWLVSGVLVLIMLIALLAYESNF